MYIQYGIKELSNNTYFCNDFHEIYGYKQDNDNIYYYKKYSLPCKQNSSYFKSLYSVINTHFNIQEIRKQILVKYPNYLDYLSKENKENQQVDEESIMNESVCFFLNDNPALSECLQNQLFDLNYSWAGKKVVENTHKKYLFVNPDNKSLQYSNVLTESDKIRYQVIDLSFLAPPQIKIGDHKVEFQAGSIKVGCTTVSNDLVKEIVKHLKD